MKEFLMCLPQKLQPRIHHEYLTKILAGIIINNLTSFINCRHQTVVSDLSPIRRKTRGIAFFPIVMGGDEAMLLKSIAGALHLPPDEVFRAAGILPSVESDAPPTLAEWIEIFMQADEHTREDLLNYAQYRADQERKAKRRPANPLEQTVD